MAGNLNEVGNDLSDLLDWFRACHCTSNVFADFELNFGADLVTRRFTPNMAVTTAIRLSQQWHEAVAERQDSNEDLVFPPPWLPPAQRGGLAIVPLISTTELYQEGQTLHHCVRSFAGRVRHDECYIYSVRRDGKSIATISLERSCGRIYAQQIRGPCNSTPPKEVTSFVGRWISANEIPF
jgi:hypothetical protein